MTTGVVPSDAVAFYAADIGETRLIAAGAASVAVAGRLPPGRWLVQVKPSDATAITWLQVGKYNASTALVATAGVGPKKIPVGPAILALEFVVRENYNDALAAICSAGTADVWLTLVSRRA